MMERSFLIRKELMEPLIGRWLRITGLQKNNPGNSVPQSGMPSLG